MTNTDEKYGTPVDSAALEDLSRGMIYAELAITDNKEGTLAKIGKANPWHIQALKLITGSLERAHLPLRDILDQDLGGLILDTELDEHGITPGGQFLDTQGYVAHNNECIVVSFRCTTSIFDWMSNINSTTSVWDLEDVEQGFSGYCSGFSDLCCQGSNYKPRVHTGMYNNFLSVLPEVKKYVEQFLTDYEKPRKLYIVGHSLGAGIANLMAIYFLSEHNWNLLPQSLVLVTAGSPRSICQSMKEVIDQKRKEYGDNVRFYRIVKGNDAVVSMPPKILGFDHVVGPTVIKDDGNILLISKEDDIKKDNLSEIFGPSQEEDLIRNIAEVTDEPDNTEDVSDEDAKYNRVIAKIPKAFRDHMPDFYLIPILKAQGVVDGSNLKNDDTFSDKNEDPTQKIDQDQKKTKKKTRKSWVPKMFNKRSAKKIEPTDL